MSDAVQRAIANAESGFVEAPAGCGKTETIVRTVGHYCAGTQLVLTHTHAGVDALRARFSKHRVPVAKYHIDTIAGWSWGWVRRYPCNANYCGSTEMVAWEDVYGAMTRLLDREFVRLGVVNSYAGVIVDEYQDCTVGMHRLVGRLNALLPCRVLGDELQGIFGFDNQPLVAWTDVRAEFGTDLGVLDTPHRWLGGGNRELGRWLLGSRRLFRAKQEPDYSESPISVHHVGFSELTAHLIRWTHRLKGSHCVIGPKARSLGAALETALVRRGYRILEANDLPRLRDLVRSLAEGTHARKCEATVRFLRGAFGGLGQDTWKFVKRLVDGAKQQPRTEERRTLARRHAAGFTPYLVLDLLTYCENHARGCCKWPASVSALRCILENYCDGDAELTRLYGAEVRRRLFAGRRRIYRAVGSTLLVKGLEFDHVIVVRNSDWQRSWGGYRDLYVALTRGSRTVELVELAA